MTGPSPGSPVPADTVDGPGQGAVGSARAGSRPVRLGRTVWRVMVGGARWVTGAFLSTFLLFSVLVVGWTARAARREVLKSWWRGSPVRDRHGSFADFAAADLATREHGSWPTWFRGTHVGDPADSGRCRRAFRTLLGGVVQNVRVGVPMILNTWVVTLPGCLLWAVAWFAGWQNSFNKGYEHAWFGPTVFVLGMVLFSGVMGFVPLAQARQASTGDWRRFYDVRLIFRLVRRQWLASLGLAVVWAAACGAVLLVKLMPQLAQYVPSLTERPPSGMASVSRNFFLLMALGLFPLFVAVRLLAARVYANALRSGYQSGAVTEDDLGDSEWQALHRLELLTPVPVPERRWFIRIAAWLATRTGQATAAAAVFAVWFGLSFLVLVSEFAAASELGRGWWNQPMIQLPWFDYTPNRLRGLKDDQ